MSGLPSNIERRHRFGEYVGYGTYATYAIRRGGRGWETFRHWGVSDKPHMQPPARHHYMTARTLVGLSDLLADTMKDREGRAGQ
jgi:hypothetical protein